MAEERWQPIETYPKCETCADANCDWGPDVLLLMDGHVVVGGLEAGMWLAHDPGEWICMTSLESKPTHWLPLPEPPHG